MKAKNYSMSRVKTNYHVTDESRCSEKIARVCFGKIAFCGLMIVSHDFIGEALADNCGGYPAIALSYVGIDNDVIYESDDKSNIAPVSLRIKLTHEASIQFTKFVWSDEKNMATFSICIDGKEIFSFRSLRGFVNGDVLPIMISRFRRAEIENDIQAHKILSVGSVSSREFR